MPKSFRFPHSKSIVKKFKISLPTPAICPTSGSKNGVSEMLKRRNPHRHDPPFLIPNPCRRIIATTSPGRCEALAIDLRAIRASLAPSMNYEDFVALSGRTECSPNLANLCISGKYGFPRKVGRAVMRLRSLLW